MFAPMPDKPLPLGNRIAGANKPNPIVTDCVVIKKIIDGCLTRLGFDLLASAYEVRQIHRRGVSEIVLRFIVEDVGRDHL